VTRDRAAPTRMFGVPMGRGRSRRKDEEPQRALGFPVDMFGDIDVEFFRGFLHPVKACRRWQRRRRLGAYALDDGDTTGRG